MTERRGTLRHPRSAESKLRRAIRKECHRQLDDFFRLADETTGLPMLDVLVAHVALGFGINVGVQVRHPEEDGRAVEDPQVTARQSQPALVQ